MSCGSSEQGAPLGFQSVINTPHIPYVSSCTQSDMPERARTAVLAITHNSGLWKNTADVVRPCCYAPLHPLLPAPSCPCTHLTCWMASLTPLVHQLSHPRAAPVEAMRFSHARTLTRASATLHGNTALPLGYAPFKRSCDSRMDGVTADTSLR